MALTWTRGLKSEASAFSLLLRPSTAVCDFAESEDWLLSPSEWKLGEPFVSWDEILEHQFKKRHESFAPSQPPSYYSRPLLLADFNENHTYILFSGLKNPYKKVMETRISDPDPDSMRSVDPDPFSESGFGFRRAKMTHWSTKKLRNFMLWSAGCSLLRADCLDVL